LPKWLYGTLTDLQFASNSSVALKPMGWNHPEGRMSKGKDIL
jgi:hypothetical protein